MSKDLNPKQYTDAIAKLQEEAFQAATALLKEKGEKCYIANSEEYATFSGEEDDYGTQSIFGVGLNEDGELCAAIGRDQYQPEEWTDAAELWPKSYPIIYEIVASNIDNTITKAEAEDIAEEHWGNCEEEWDEEWDEEFDVDED
ncbi:hypothetical protein [uncultured Prevotella sp.]|uniref:hypothetical protein n=1 Tax=uncultured Prevotella sp. TaxID=159272 RepID=UPI00266BCE14|nr:hypothetical protein [uncultured Prevotella sp.]